MGYSIYIDGKPILDDIYTSELRFTLSNFTESILSSLKPINVGDKINICEFIECCAFNMSSPEMEDQGVMVFFYFNKMGDFLLLKDKGKYSHLKYDKDYILNILILLSKWKDKKRL